MLAQLWFWWWWGHSWRNWWTFKDDLLLKEAVADILESVHVGCFSVDQFQKNWHHLMNLSLESSSMIDWRSISLQSSLSSFTLHYKYNLPSFATEWVFPLAEHLVLGKWWSPPSWVFTTMIENHTIIIMDHDPKALKSVIWSRLFRHWKMIFKQ